MTGLVLPFERWPAADQALFEALFRAGDPLEERGRLAHYRAATRVGRRYAYGRWVGWLAAQEPGALDEFPVDRATGARAQAWIGSMAQLHPEARLAMLDRAMHPLKAMAPDADWQAHRRLAARLRREKRDHVSHRKTGRILSSRVLFTAGLDHAAGRTLPPGASELARAKACRDGTMIAALALMPLRRRSFLDLRLGTSLTVTGTGMTIVLEPGDTKTGMAWESPVPASIAAPLRHYIAEARPYLLSRGGHHGDVLWLNDHGAAYGPEHFSDRLRRLTQKLVGTPVSPHLFRDCAATTLACESPEAARLSRAILGHRGFATATRHYNHAKALESGHDFAGLIDALREGAR